jgi:hypothetical protein
VLPGACARDVFVGYDRSTPSNVRADGGGSKGDANTVEDAPASCHVTKCQNHVYACGDCVDNDGDGLVDMADPDCVGPCQNAEDTFYGSIPGQNHAACTQDCYFDNDSGSGNDGCIWSHACDPLSVAPDYPPEGQQCAYDANAPLPKGIDCATAEKQQTAQCATVCGPLTPNGCDCFGCCVVPGANTAIWLGSVDAAGNPSCDAAHVADPTRCKPCTQVAACTNPCDTCELCVGKKALPASCAGGSCPTPSCPAGDEPCGADCLPPCPDGKACITGCCIPAPS